MIAPLLTPERVSDILGLNDPDAVRDLITFGDLHGIEISPGVVRVKPADLKRFIDVRRRGFRPLPSATRHVGHWTLPSGRGIDVFVGATAVQGARRLRVDLDDVAPLSDEDRAALEHGIMPAVAEKIRGLIGRGGWGFLLTP